MLAFVPDFPVLAAFVAASLVLGVTPGPDMTYFLARTVSQGRAAGFAALVGASSGLIVHSVLVAAGLSVLLAASATAFAILKIIGAAYLAYLALDAIRNGSSLSLDKETRTAQSLQTIYLKGLLINLLNPKIIVFFITFLPQFVGAHEPHAVGKLLFLGFLFILVNLPLCSGLILAAEKIAGVLRNSRRVTRAIDWLFAGVFSAFAVKLVLTQSR